MENLSSIKQERDENVSQFFQHVENLLSRIFANMYAIEGNDNSLTG